MNRRERPESRRFSDGPTSGDPQGFTRAAPASQVIEVEIDELVLTGFPRAQGPGIAEAIRETLGRLFAAEQMPWRGLEATQLDRLDAGTVHLSRSRRACSTGEQLARAVYRSLPK
jgi:hypothetical protein